MALGIPGHVGQILRDTLAQQLEQQLVQQQLEQRRKEHAETVRLQQERLTQDARQHTEMLAFQDRARRDRANAAGVEDLFRQRTLMDREAAATAAADAAASQQRAVGNIEHLIALRAPKAEIVGQLARIDPTAAVQEVMEPTEEDEVRRTGLLAEARAQAEAKYRAPPGGAPDFEWVTRDGTPLQIRKGTAASGDRPYDAAAARQNLIGPVQERLREKRLAAAQWSLDKLKSLSEQINTQQGPAAIGTGVVRRGKAALGLDPIVNEARRIRQTAAMQFAVAIQGAANLSNQERTALLQMIPGETVDHDTAVALYDDLGEMLQAMTGRPSHPPPPDAPMRRPIPDIPGAEAESTDGGKTWRRVQ